MPGYSKTPLIRKLGFIATAKTGSLTVVVYRAPPEYKAWLGELPDGVRIISRTTRPIQAGHAFVTKRAELDKFVGIFRNQLVPTGFCWISWPKKASKVATEVTEGTIRELALPTGLVDVKVCAVSEVWSGLKLMIRKSER